LLIKIYFQISIKKRRPHRPGKAKGRPANPLKEDLIKVPTGVLIEAYDVLLNESSGYQVSLRIEG
jgi:hypothetical protein